MEFSSVTLRIALATVPSARRWWVAYSGGVDSHCLLHALASIAAELPELIAVHVDHGLNPESERWAQHCASICAGLRVPYRLLQVKVQSDSGEGLEAAARTARYAALARVMAFGEVLFTAHHLDDQAETVLLQLLRGAGSRGLAAMPALAAFHAGYLVRPLLNHSRAELLAYAHAAGLAWVDDDDNLNQRHDRNYLRHQIFPLLQQRWPAAALTFARTATHQAEATSLLESLAAQDIAQLTRPRSNTLPVAPMLGLGPARARNLLRFWIRDNGHAVPSTAILERVLAEAAMARQDATPLISWTNSELRRYRNLLYLMKPLPDLPLPDWELEWNDLETPLRLHWGILTAQPLIGVGLSELARIQGITVRLRQGGERCRLAGTTHHRPLKDLWQAAGIPPWERTRTPLLFVNGVLAAVPGFGPCHCFQASAGEIGWKIEWQFTHGQIDQEYSRHRF
ncbi:tRNA(Ile)-lysidine synthase [Gammaproteobacteria bacterium]